MNEDRIFLHTRPVRGDDADSQILVPIVNEDSREYYDYESMPAKRLTAREYQVCAIPLVAYDLNLDDIITVDAHGYFAAVSKKSDRKGFRLAMSTSQDDHTENIVRYEKVITYLAEQECEIELYTHNLIAVDVDNVKKAAKFERKLSKLLKKGLIHAWERIDQV